VVTKLSSNFRGATTIQETTHRAPADNEIVIKNHFVGVNASDINFSSGKYLKGVPPPFDAGFEGLGEVVGKGDKVSKVDIGDFVLFFYTAVLQSMLS